MKKGFKIICFTVFVSGIFLGVIPNLISDKWYWLSFVGIFGTLFILSELVEDK